MNTRYFIYLFIITCFASCVSKKKYLQLQSNAEVANSKYHKRNKELVNYNDSILWVMNQRDSLIDSLSNQLTEYQKKKEKSKALYTGSDTKKNSILTKEQEFSKKAVFIYNFAKNIEWPVIYNGAEFVVGVAGDAMALKELTTLMTGKKVGGKKIIIKEYSTGSRYNVVYVDASKSHNFITIKSVAKKNKTLLVTDDQNLNNQGAHISFIIDKDKVRFIVNKQAIEKSGMKVSEELMRFSG